ncbi:MAG: MBL fold metallo-hydrolase [Ferruginibacter sp.]
MSLFVASLNSGSNGNCYYIGSSHDAVLIDVGISCRETEKRMKTLGLNIKNVRAIFVSHEHGDHIKGVSTLANKYSLPVYITGKTALQGPRLIRHLSRPFIADEAVQIGDLTVIPFQKKHDAADPHSFVIESKGTRIGVFTDIGEVCSEVIRYFGICHAAFLEANYDEEMLEQGKYPIHLKNRIRGGHGHLSNRQALELFLHHRSPQLSHLLLSHLSKENNSPELAMELFAPHANGTEVLVASRYTHSAVYEITSQGESALPGRPVRSKPRQLGLFG